MIDDQAWNGKKKPEALRRPCLFSFLGKTLTRLYNAFLTWGKITKIRDFRFVYLISGTKLNAFDDTFVMKRRKKS